MCLVKICILSVMLFLTLYLVYELLHVFSILLDWCDLNSAQEYRCCEFRGKPNLTEKHKGISASVFYIYCPISMKFHVRDPYMMLSRIYESREYWPNNWLTFLMVVKEINTLWTGDADLRPYITTVQDGWRKSAFLTRAWFPRTTHLITQYMEHFSGWSHWRMFLRGLEL